MIRASETATMRTASPEEVALAKARFREDRWLKIGGFLEGAFLEKLQSWIRSGAFVPKSHEGVGHELCLWDSPAVDALTFVCNDPALFRFVSEVCGVGPIGCFTGRMYRMAAGAAHHEHWHSDVGDHRLVALSVNLSEEPYRGGVLSIREQGRPNSGRVIENVVPGDAIIFLIDEALEHSISDVEAGPPKTAWAGWFRSQPVFKHLLTGEAKL